jgi:hypothetical protein
MILPGFTAERALVRSNTAWCGTARAALDTATVRIANLPGGRYCSSCPPGGRGWYWCCWPTRNGELCEAYVCPPSFDPCAYLKKGSCDWLLCECEAGGGVPFYPTPPDPNLPCGWACT